MSTGVTAPTGPQQLLEALKSVITPTFGVVWLGPFDQLVSAGRALLLADKYGYADRDLSTYYFDVHAQLPSLLVGEAQGEASSSPKALDNFLSSFYFNAGVQRLTFATERLVTTFVGIKCHCGSRGPDVSRNKHGRWPPLKDCLKHAKKRLRHISEDDGYSGKITNLESLIAAVSNWKYPRFSLDKGLAMLRDHVNVRKHSVYIRSEAISYGPLNSSGQPWTPREQAEVAIASFVLASRAYNEAIAWHPDANG